MNIAFHQIWGDGIDYEYDGKTYHFSKAVIETYDETISAMSNKDITVTAIILKRMEPGHSRPDRAGHHTEVQRVLLHAQRPDPGGL